MKKFTIPCDFNGSTSPFAIYVGEPEKEHHPLHFQGEWLANHRGGTIPGRIMESLAKLHEISKKNNVPLEDLCEYALNEFGENGDSEKDLPAAPVPKPRS